MKSIIARISSLTSAGVFAAASGCLIEGSAQSFELRFYAFLNIRVCDKIGFNHKAKKLPSSFFWALEG